MIMQSKKELNSKKRELIQESALEVISVLNLSTTQIAEIINNKYNTVHKKRFNHENKVFSYSDLKIIHEFMEEHIKKTMVKRREIKDFLDLI